MSKQITIHRKVLQPQEAEEIMEEAAKFAKLLGLECQTDIQSRVYTREEVTDFLNRGDLMDNIDWQFVTITLSDNSPELFDAPAPIH